MNKSRTDLKVLYERKRQSSLDRGIAFELTFEQYRKLREEKFCFYTGVELTQEQSFKCPYNWTLDRIDPYVGYTSGNTVVCAYFVNNAKNSAFDALIKLWHTDRKLFMQISKKLRKVHFNIKII